MVQNKTGERRARAPYEIVVNADESPAEWLKERQKLITATDIPSIIGVPGARSALETWYQKKDALVGRAENQAILQAKAAGHAFEDANAGMFASTRGEVVKRSQDLIRSTRHKWLGCTLDYVIVRGNDDYRLPLELKNAGSHVADEMWPLGGEPHLTWQVQLMTQIAVMVVPSGGLSAWLGSPFVHHRWCMLERDMRIEEIILEEGSSFCASLRGKSPPAEKPEVAFEILKRLSPEKATHKVISLPKSAQLIDNTIAALERQVNESKQELKLCQERLDSARAEMGALIGENYGGKLPSGAVWTFKHVHVSAHMVEAHSYRRLNRVSAAASKTKRTTWKTSK